MTQESLFDEHESPAWGQSVPALIVDKSAL